MLRALLIQILFTVRSEWQPMEELDFSLLYRRFVGLSIGDPVWNNSTLSKNRDLLLAHDVAAWILEAIKSQAAAREQSS